MSVSRIRQAQGDTLQVQGDTLQVSLQVAIRYFGKLSINSAHRYTMQVEGDTLWMGLPVVGTDNNNGKASGQNLATGYCRSHKLRQTSVGGN